MYIQRVQNNDHNTNFNATIKIQSKYYNMEKYVVDFFETEFANKTQNIDGHIDVIIDGSKREIYDMIQFSNGIFQDSLNVNINLLDSKETLLKKFISVLNVFKLRENAQFEINKLKADILGISDKAHKDSLNELRKNFPISNFNETECNDIAPRNSYLSINIPRKTTNQKFENPDKEEKSIFRRLFELW